MSRPILIDYATINSSQKELSTFLKRISAPPITKLSVGLLLTISESDFIQLQKIQQLNSIVPIDYAYTVYDKKKHICEIVGFQRDSLLLYIKELKKYMDKSTIHIRLLMDENITENVRSAIDAGFAHPQISKGLLEFSPQSPEYKLYMSVSAGSGKKTLDPLSIMNETIHVLSQFVEDHEAPCSMNVKFSPETIRYMKRLCKEKPTRNKNGTHSQKEIAGALSIEKVETDVYILQVDKDSLIEGEEEGVPVKDSRYNFHSHPHEAYVRHEVDKAWPSGQDYVGFLGAVIKYGTVFHIVVTLEGVYTISIDKGYLRGAQSWVSSIKKSSSDKVEDYVFKTYNISQKKKWTPQEYVEKVNLIKGPEGGRALFNVHYLDWDNANQVMTISYPREDMNCPVR